jgi:hypothetical protein
MQRDQFVLLTRLGFAARGLLYLVIAWLVIRTGRTEDMEGALEYVGEGGGKWLLIAMTAGFIAYGLWRLADAAMNIETHDDDKMGAVKRVGAAGSGLIYLLLAWQAIRLITSAGGSPVGRRRAPRKGTQTALNLPGGGDCRYRRPDPARRRSLPARQGGQGQLPQAPRRARRQCRLGQMGRSARLRGARASCS